MISPNLAIYLLSALVALIALTVHEYAHGFAADKLGDPTARVCGRLSLNPLRHLDLLGALCIVFFRFGWAKPVPINPRLFKRPKRDFALTALAGPLSNLMLAFFGVLVFLLMDRVSRTVTTVFGATLIFYVCLFFLLFCQINIGLAVFNLLPVPPLDGSRLLFALLPDRAYDWMLKNERNIYFGLLGWLFVGGFLSRLMLQFSFVHNSVVLTVLARILSLSWILDAVIDFIMNLFMSFWGLIPGL